MIFERSTKPVNSTDKSPIVRPYFKSVAVEFDLTRDRAINESARSVTGFFSVEVVDSDAEIVLVSGIALDRFRRNPILLLQHDMDSPIGSVTWLKRGTCDGNAALMGKVFFSRSDLGEETFQLVRDGTLSGFSIGMAPGSIARREATLAEEVRFPGVRRIIAQCELMEVSIVSVPANALAVVSADAKGILKLTRPLLEPTIKAAMSKPPEQKRKPVLERMPDGPYRMTAGECDRWSRFVYGDNERQLDPYQMVAAGSYKSIDLGPWPHDAEERVTALRQFRAMEKGRL